MTPSLKILRYTLAYIVYLQARQPFIQENPLTLFLCFYLGPGGYVFGRVGLLFVCLSAGLLKNK